jgi:hypothetical protein
LLGDMLAVMDRDNADPTSSTDGPAGATSASFMYNYNLTNFMRRLALPCPRRIALLPAGIETADRRRPDARTDSSMRPEAATAINYKEITPNI